jgi:hypothetical protein
MDRAPDRLQGLPIPWQVGWLIPPLQKVPAHAGLTVKLGGSLLTRHDWPSMLQKLLDGMSTGVRIVVGGGPVVDGLRQLDAACPQPAEFMHRLAIEAMGMNARTVAKALRLPLLCEPSHSPCQRGVIEPVAWLESGHFDSLPAGWEVTSDSLSARVAVLCQEPLLLLKSTRPPERNGQNTLADLAAMRWIDPIFPSAAASLSGLAWAVPPFRETQATP